jgi:glutathione S-transferase
MRLYGTTTSPFVRRVRVAAAEAGVTIDLVNTAPDAGQAALRQVSPIWKVPVAEVDGRTLFDSRAIIDWITTTRGWGRIAPPRDRWLTSNLVNAIDGALDSAITVFYLRRDGLDVANLPFAHRQRDRVTAIFDWLDGERRAGRLGAELGLAELSLVCTLDWMEFRDAYPVASLDGRFDAIREALAGWASVAQTRPHA